MGQFAGFSIDFADAGASHADLATLKSGIVSSFLVVFKRPNIRIKEIKRQISGPVRREESEALRKLRIKELTPSSAPP